MSCSRVGSNIDTPNLIQSSPIRNKRFEIKTLQTLELLILFFDIELAQMKLDELVKNVINLDINNESMDDNHGHSQD